MGSPYPGIAGGSGTSWFLGRQDARNAYKGSIDELRFYPRALTSGEMLNLYNGKTIQPLLGDRRGTWVRDGTTPCESLNETVYFKFDTSGTVFNSEVNNYSGIGLSGVQMTGGVYSNGSAISLGSPCYVEFSGLNTFTDISIAFWFNPLTWGKDQYIINKEVSSNNAMLIGNTSNGSNLNYFVRVSGVTSNLASVPGLAIQSYLGSWVHFAVTHDTVGSVAKMYLNGSLSQTNGSFIHTIDFAAPWQIGGNANTQDSSKFYSGLIDDFRLYNKALSPYEVAILYSGGRVAQQSLLVSGGFEYP